MGVLAAYFELYMTWAEGRFSLSVVVGPGLGMESANTTAAAQLAAVCVGAAAGRNHLDTSIL